MVDQRIMIETMKDFTKSYLNNERDTKRRRKSNCRNKRRRRHRRLRIQSEGSTSTSSSSNLIDSFNNKINLTNNLVLFQIALNLLCYSES